MNRRGVGLHPTLSSGEDCPKPAHFLGVNKIAVMVEIDVSRFFFVLSRGCGLSEKASRGKVTWPLEDIPLLKGPLVLPT